MIALPVRRWLVLGCVLAINCAHTSSRSRSHTEPHVPSGECHARAVVIEPTRQSEPTAATGVVLHPVKGDTAEQRWRTVLRDELVSHGLTVRDDGMALPPGCPERPEVCRIVMPTGAGSVPADLAIAARVEAEQIVVVLLEIRSGREIYRLDARQHDGDVILPVIWPRAVAEAARDFVWPPAPLTAEQLEELECLRSDGRRGQGCPEQDVLRGWERIPLRPLSPASTRLRWRSQGTMVVMSWDHVREQLDDRPALREAIDRHGVATVSALRKRCRDRDRDCSDYVLERDDALDGIVAEQLEAGRAEVHACDGPPVSYVLRYERHGYAEGWTEYRIPYGTTFLEVLAWIFRATFAGVASESAPVESATLDSHALLHSSSS